MQPSAVMNFLSFRYGRQQGRPLGRGDRGQRGIFGKEGGAEKIGDEEEPQRGRHPALRGERGGIALGVVERGGIGEPAAGLPWGEAQPDQRKGAE